jgi:ribosomal protein L11 methyltransferase
MGYLEFEIPVRSWSRDEKEIMVAMLSQIAFDGFLEREEMVQAYVRREAFSEELFNQVIDDLLHAGIHLQYSFHEATEQNWNEAWEKKFEPVLIMNRVLIRAPFHESRGDLACTLIIEPKMSFGTGHHHTTRLMIEAMLELDLKGKKVLDMGCGTGVLGILADHLGASWVLAVDNDQWAFENTLENVARNAAPAVAVKLGDLAVLEDGVFDVILANITRNILVRDIPGYCKHLVSKGILVVSGFLAEDVQFVLNTAYQCGLEHQKTGEKANWISLSFIKP